jgi:hypothetical protein
MLRYRINEIGREREIAVIAVIARDRRDRG